jgi:hypothetical protein
MKKGGELSREIKDVSKSLKPDSQRIWTTASSKVPAPPCLNRAMTQMGSLTPLNLVFTTTEQTGRPGGTDHPSKMKHNGLFKEPFFPFAASGGGVRAHFSSAVPPWFPSNA